MADVSATRKPMVRRHRRYGAAVGPLCLSLMLGLAACDDRAGPTDRTLTTNNLAQSANAGPGTKRISSDQAAELFTIVCIGSLPDFATMLTKFDRGFVQNSKTGTVYSRQYDVSFKLINNDCSMVFSTDDSAGETLAKMRATHPQTRAPDPRFLGTYNARIAKQ